MSRERFWELINRVFRRGPPVPNKVSCDVTEFPAGGGFSLATVLAGQPNSYEKHLFDRVKDEWNICHYGPNSDLMERDIQMRFTLKAFTNPFRVGLWQYVPRRAAGDMVMFNLVKPIWDAALYFSTFVTPAPDPSEAMASAAESVNDST